jgi:hypothetical protein
LISLPQAYDRFRFPRLHHRSLKEDARVKDILKEGAGGHFTRWLANLAVSPVMADGFLSAMMPLSISE